MEARTPFCSHVSLPPPASRIPPPVSPLPYLQSSSSSWFHNFSNLLHSVFFILLFFSLLLSGFFTSDLLFTTLSHFCFLFLYKYTKKHKLPNVFLLEEIRWVNEIYRNLGSRWNLKMLWSSHPLDLKLLVHFFRKWSLGNLLFPRLTNVGLDVSDQLPKTAEPTFTLAWRLDLCSCVEVREEPRLERNTTILKID